MRESVIVCGARTAFGKLGGMFRGVRATELGAAAIGETVRRSGLEPDRIDGVLMGMVLQAGAGQLPSRQAARGAGLDWSIPAETINKVCASGFRAVTQADLLIRAGEADALIAGGMESMGSAPYAMFAGRWGARMGNAELTDLMQHDGLLCPFDGVLMGAYGDKAALDFGISRAEQDDWALRSHVRAVSAGGSGRFAEEIVPFVTSAGPQAADECPRPDTDAAKLARLRPSFDPGGTVTAGNAPGVNDGAAALLVMEREEALRTGHRPLARIAGHAHVATQPSRLAEAPAFAIRKLLQKTGRALDEIHVIEVNEAFAAVPLICGKLLGWDEKRVNVNGGAVALGHPIGASGARIVLTLVHELLRRGGGLGIAAICSGGAQGDAVLIQVDG